MPDLTLTKTQILGGHWEGVLTGDGNAAPGLCVTHLGNRIDGVVVTDDAADGGWRVRVPIPPEVIADGVQTFVITDDATGRTLGSFALLAGEALAEDIRAEMDLLRAELDMLKRAFRRHCLETAG